MSFLQALVTYIQKAVLLVVGIFSGNAGDVQALHTLPFQKVTQSTYPYTPEISITTGVGNISYLPSHDQNIHITETVEASHKKLLENRAQLKHTTQALTIIAQTDKTKDSKKSRWRVHYAIAAPQHLYATLCNACGDINVTQATKRLEVTSATGAVTIPELAKSSMIKTGTGTITVGAKNEIQQLTIESGTGSVEIEANSITNAHVKTGSSCIAATIHNPKFAHLNFKTGTGNIDLHIPTSSTAHCKLATGVGTITATTPDKVYHSSWKKRTITFDLNSPTQGCLSAKSGTGNISLTV